MKYYSQFCTSHLLRCILFWRILLLPIFIRCACLKQATSFSQTKNSSLCRTRLCEKALDASCYTEYSRLFFTLSLRLVSLSFSFGGTLTMQYILSNGLYSLFMFLFVCISTQGVNNQLGVLPDLPNTDTCIALETNIAQVVFFANCIFCMSTDAIEVLHTQLNSSA